MKLPFSLQNIPDNQTLPTLDPHRGSASVHFKSPDSGNKHHHMRAETRIPAFDVKKLFHSDVCSESCFSHCKEKSNCKNAIPIALMSTSPQLPPNHLFTVFAKILTYKSFGANELECNPVCNDRRIPVCDVGKRSSVNKHWSALWKSRQHERTCQSCFKMGSHSQDER